MSTVIVPIVKNKKGNITDMDNYRPIAITTVFSKVIELLLLHRYSDLLCTTDNQFGFRTEHSTDMCVFALKQVIDFYISNNSPMFICYMDASKAFDRINHWSLFRRLLNRSIPKLIVRLIIFWYTMQTFIIQWGSCLSAPFTCTNGVRQGGILSPLLFNVYVDDLSLKLTALKTGCNLNNTFMNHFMYADDTVLLAPSAVSLQKLINACSQFAADNDMIFNYKKTVCMYIKSKKFKDLQIPNFTLNDNVIDFVDHEKYLGVINSSNCKDDDDLNRQMRSLYGRGNALVRNFKHCSDLVKFQLFKTFCCNLYCCHLWSFYNHTSYTKVKVAYKRIYRSLLNLDYRSSITTHMVLSNVDSFDVFVRKSVFNFKQRLLKSGNGILSAIVNSLHFISSHTYNKWLNVLY